MLQHSFCLPSLNALSSLLPKVYTVSLDFARLVELFIVPALACFPLSTSPAMSCSCLYILSSYRLSPSIQY